MRWFDGHLDLTYIALHGRDLTRDPHDCGGTLQPASVTFPALAAANVQAALSTVFVRQRSPSVTGDYTFATDAEAHAAARRQLNLHHAWQNAGLIQPLATLSSHPSHVSHPIPNPRSPIQNPPLQIALALEGAACLRTLEDLDTFHAAGVRMVSLAWAEGSRWAGGDQSGGDITPEGKQLIARLDERYITHDVSHLSERAFWTLLETARGTVVASHSNCRSLLPDAKHPERHLSDAQIRALAARNGKIGINLFARFLIPPAELALRRATALDVVRHITHIEQLAGRRDLIALGSDMDSGFSTDLLPADVQGPGELHQLANALAQAGWSDADIKNFAWGWESIAAK